MLKQADTTVNVEKKEIYDSRSGVERHTESNGDKWSQSLQSVFELALESQGPERTARLLEQLVGQLRATPRVYHALHQHHSARATGAVSGRSRNGAAHQELRPLERHGDGGQRQPQHSGRRPHLHLRLVGHACTKWLSTISSAGATDDFPGDMVYFQGHAAPGIYARAFLEGRLDEQHLHNFRQELAEGGGLSSYPHPYLMPDFWQFPTVSMGLGPIMSIYQARFNRYLRARGFVNGRGAEGLGVSRRRRMRRAGDARRAHAGVARKPRQPDLGHQLQPAAARRPGARQRQDHPGTRSRLSAARAGMSSR